MREGEGAKQGRAQPVYSRSAGLFLLHCQLRHSKPDRLLHVRGQSRGDTLGSRVLLTLTVVGALLGEH
jgi:hypothetical protein